MNRLKQACTWLKRIAHTRGFGIQSPTDYAFVCGVVNESWPYYAYASFAQTDGKRRQKLGKLYFRLANYMQPEVIVDMAGYADYLSAGCRRARITNSIEGDTHGVPMLVIASPHDISPALLRCCTQQTMLVVEHTGSHPQQWQAVEQWPEATVTFNLYHCGIALFNPTRAKQHYLVYF